MKLKKIKEKYILYKCFTHKGEYQVYSHESGKWSVHKYLCNIQKIKSKIYVEGIYVRNIKEFDKEVRRYVDSLPFLSDFYIPGFREGVFEQNVIYNYMKEKGFRKDWNSDYWIWDKKDIYSKQSNLKIGFIGLDDFNLKPITIIYPVSRFSWVEVKVERNAEKIIEKLESFLKTLHLSESAQHITASEKFKFKLLDVVEKTIDKNLNVWTKDKKEEIKQQLSSIIDKL